MILFFVVLMQSHAMEILPVLLLVILFVAFLGLGVFFALQKRARQKRARQFPFRRRDDDDDDDLPGEKQHCDGYSVGTFYW